MNQPFKACQAVLCIRNLPVKIQAPIGAFSIERTCLYARENSCRVKFEVSQYCAPVRETREGSLREGAVV